MRFIITTCLLFFYSFGFLFGQSAKNEKSTPKVMNSSTLKTPKNVLGTALQACCFDPKTGYFRDGFCKTRSDDVGTHVICAIVTQDFLTFTRSKGNDLETPAPQYSFPGLKPGDKWCLCALRWKEAYNAGFAPPVVLESTNKIALEYVTIEALKSKAVKK
jgi:uncharacterized protein